MNSQKKKIETNSKFLSLILRHQPDLIGLTLDAEGWTPLDELVTLANANGYFLDREMIVDIVAGSDKQRFAMSNDGKLIRANQGHSVKISLGLPPSTPPDILYHGTATRFLASIRLSGLHTAKRQHVHLSSEPSVAKQVGARHGKPVVLLVDARVMTADGHHFYLSENGVWLTNAVPVKYIHEMPE
jgi:putative RNA 2'-phosphotransferase